MKINQPGVYCFWNKINDKTYVGSAQDLPTRLNQHFKNVKSNKPLQDEIKEYGLEAFHISQVTTETHADALQLEQRCLDYLFGKNKPKYNMMAKVGGGCVESKENHRELSLQGGGGLTGRTKAQHRELSLQGRTKAEHTELCLQGRTKAEHRELSAQGGGSKAKPFFIKEYPSGKILLEAESTHDKKAQEVLKMSQSRICNQLTQNYCSLFIRLNSGQIVYLEYTDQSLSKRAKLLDRSIESDYNKVMGFHLEKQTLNLQHKDGHTAFLKNYRTYSEAARMLGLKTSSELSNFYKMAIGKIPSSSGWSLVT